MEGKILEAIKVLGNLLSDRINDLNNKVEKMAEENTSRFNQIAASVKQTNVEVRDVKAEVKKVQADVEFIKDAVKVAYEDIGELQKAANK